MDGRLLQSLQEATDVLLRQGKMEDLLQLSLNHIFTTLFQHSERLDNLERSQQSFKGHMHEHITNLKQDIHGVASQFEPALASRCEEIQVFYENAAQERATAASTTAEERTETVNKKENVKSAMHVAHERSVAFSSAGLGVSDIDVENSDSTTSLYSAIQKGQLSTVKHLVTESGDDMEYVYGNSPLVWAAHCGHLDILQYLLFETSADYEATNEFGNNALSVAAFMGHTEAVRLLWTTIGTGIENRDVRGFTPLHIASSGGHLEVAKYLLDEAGANAEATTNDGRSVLAVAAICGHLEVVRFLVTEVGASTRRTNNAGMTPLLFASSKGHLQILKYLLRERRACADHSCSRGGTCLHHAAAEGRLKIIQHLRSKTGVNILAIDEHGLNPCSWAMSALSASFKSGSGGVSQAKVDRLKKAVEYLKAWADEEGDRQQNDAF